jgi:hypothetical protein
MFPATAKSLGGIAMVRGNVMKNPLVRCVSKNKMILYVDVMAIHTLTGAGLLLRA